MGRKEIETYLQKKSRGWSNSNFLDQLQRFCEDYGLPHDKFFLESSTGEKNKVLIKNEWKPLALALMHTYKGNPYLVHESQRKDKVSLEMIRAYNQTIIDLVENEFPGDLKYEVVNSSPYLTMLSEHVAMEATIKKLNEFIKALVTAEPQVRAHLWEEVHEALDHFIYRIFEIDHSLEMERKQEEAQYQSKYQQLIQDYFIKKGLEAEVKKRGTIAPESIEKIFNQSPHYHYYLTLLNARKKDVEYMEQCGNISQFIAMKLREAFQLEREMEDIQEREGKIYQVTDRDPISPKEIAYMQAATDALKENKDDVSRDELLMQKKQLQNEIDAHVQKIKNAAPSFKTKEEECQELLQEMTLAIENKSITPEMRFYMDFLAYAKRIREYTQKNQDKKNMINDLVISVACQSPQADNKKK